MSEWVRVNYPKQKKVRIDGDDLGFTNRTLFLGEPGTFWFDLGDSDDYKPKRLRRRVRNTSRQRPLVIDDFEPKDDE